MLEKEMSAIKQKLAHEEQLHAQTRQMMDDLAEKNGTVRALSIRTHMRGGEKAQMTILQMMCSSCVI